MKKTKVMGFPLGKGEDMIACGISCIDQGFSIKIPREIVDEYELAAGDQVAWLLKGNVLFLRFSQPRGEIVDKT